MKCGLSEQAHQAYVNEKVRRKQRRLEDDGYRRKMNAQVYKARAHRPQHLPKGDPCTVCGQAYEAHLWHIKNNERVSAHRAEQYRANPEFKARELARLATAQRTKSWKDRYDPLKSRFKKVKVKYGLTRADLESRFAAQDAKCAICSDTLSLTEKRGFHVDHVEPKGLEKYVRGLLCKHCNPGLGHFQDDGERMSTAIQYLAGFDPSRFDLHRYEDVRFSSNAGRSPEYRTRAAAIQAALLTACGSKCQICALPLTLIESGGGKISRGMQPYACFDHDDASGFIRGVLCRECNLGVGSFKHSVDLLQRARGYLHVHALKIFQAKSHAWLTRKVA
jgi:hypothetical protein